MTDQSCSPAASGQWWRRALIVMAAVSVLTALTIWGRSDQETPALLGLDIGVGVVSTLLAPLALRWPVRATVPLSLLAALSPAATPAATLGVLYVARARRFPVAVGVAVLGVAAHAVQGLWRPSGGLGYGWWLLLITAGYAALVGWGALWRANRALVASLRARARQAEAEQDQRIAQARASERNRIAREMHDVLAHRLSLLATYAGALQYRPDAPPEQLSRAAAVVRDGAHQALDDLREVITLLRHDVAEDGERPQPVLADLPQLLDESRGTGVHIELIDRISPGDAVPTAVGRTAFRVVQEAVTNARRHAPGEAVRVELDGQPGARLAIAVTNRRRSGTAPASTGTGTGLIGLSERVRLAGGQFDHTATGDEFRVHAWLPWPGAPG